MPTLTAIVPAADRPATLARCAAAIAGAAEPPEEILVIDEPPHLGPAAIRNAGASRARGEVLVFVDADVTVHEDAFTRIRAAFEADPELDAVFGNYDADQRSRDTVTAFRNLLFHHVHREAAGPVVTFWSGLGAVRRDRFLMVGGFDTERFPVVAMEDIDLGVRLTQSGARIACDPDIEGTHLKSWSLAEMLRTDLFRRGIPWVVLMLRTRSVPRELNLAWRHRLSAAASLAIAWSVLRARPMRVVLPLGALLVLNQSFYRLLWERQGGARAAAGVGLHVLHHIASAAAVPLGFAVYAAERARSGARG
jgi:glycosyltransferase involved in cell wall biosynthesis